MAHEPVWMCYDIPAAGQTEFTKVSSTSVFSCVNKQMSQRCDHQNKHSSFQSLMILLLSKKVNLFSWKNMF